VRRFLVADIARCHISACVDEHREWLASSEGVVVIKMFFYGFSLHQLF